MFTARPVVSQVPDLERTAALAVEKVLHRRQACQLHQLFPVAVILRCIGNDDPSLTGQGDPDIISYRPEHRRMGDHGVWVLSFKMPAADKVRFENDRKARLNEPG